MTGNGEGNSHGKAGFFKDRPFDDIFSLWFFWKYVVLRWGEYSTRTAHRVRTLSFYRCLLRNTDKGAGYDARCVFSVDAAGAFYPRCS